MNQLNTEDQGVTIVHANLGGESDCKFTLLGHPDKTYIEGVIVKTKKIQDESTFCKKAPRHYAASPVVEDDTDTPEDWADVASDAEFENLTLGDSDD